MRFTWGSGGEATKAVLAVGALLLAAGSSDAMDGKTFTLTERHIRVFRQAAVLWAPVEAGAPAVLYSPRLLEAEDVPYADLAQRAGMRVASPPTEAQRRELDALVAELGDAFVVFMAQGAIQPGTYTYANPLAALPHAEHVTAPALHKRAVQHEVRFELTPAHVKLLKHARWEGGAPMAGWLGLNPKRPFGDMTYFELDMADILGEPSVRDAEGHLPAEQAARLDTLYEEMQAALQVFLQQAQVKPGTYPR